jgi:hypothetical protein
MLIRDGDWTLYSSDHKRGKHTWRLDNGDGTVTYRTDTIVDPIIDQNTAQRNLSQDNWAGDWHQIASVPKAILWDQLMPASMQGDDKYISKWLNDSDNGAWRTKSGVV